MEIDDNDEEYDDDEEDSEEDSEDEEEELPQAGTITEVLIANLLAPDETVADPSSPVKRKRKPKAPYIEMNLGLGVLEELKPAENDSEAKELNDRRELIGKILELRRLQAERDGDENTRKLALPVDGEQQVRKLVVIEELE
ncbi:hypothetical protein ABW21_db0202141 [Orbilia brochopaga]|nr:hypothetical protein ABW21_db0202141 [Drechslerella brochopaga]